jgi:BlaI family penicillinase repressor
MARPRAKGLTERELDVMHVFWRHGELSAIEVRDRLAHAGSRLNYTTVANLIRILYDKGFLKEVNDARPFRYCPSRSFEEVSGRLLGDVVDRVFGGSREQLLLRLVEQRALTASERAMLKEILREQGR